MSGEDQKEKVNKKPERLINLTLALLATKRYLTKEEIFSTVAGYEGNREAQDRMFERDKSDLKSLGIEIELGNLDPFFEDEPGYRIRSDSYSMQLQDLTPQEVALLALASSVWNQSTLSQDAHNALRKFKSLGIPADFSSLGSITPKFEEPRSFVATILKAIEAKSSISFIYQSESRNERTIDPYTLTLWNGSWYLIGFDHIRNDLRTFKLSRIVGEPNISDKRNSYEIPKDFHARRSLIKDDAQPLICTLKIRKGHALTLREQGEYIQNLGEFDEYRFTTDLLEPFLREILWHSEHVIPVAPTELKTRAIHLLKERANG